MRIPFWQSEWQDIPFNSLKVPLSPFKPPSSLFYVAFYNEIFTKYENFEKLPLKWRKIKADTTKAINGIIGAKSSVLSVGCGLGFVERSLIEINPTLKVDTFDFADTAKKWLKDIKAINCLTKLDSTKKYELIYCSQLLYALSDKEINDLAKFVLKHLDEGGRFLTVDTSLNPSENSQKTIGIKLKLINLIKVFLHPFYYLLLRRGSVQFWGWQRNNSEIIKLLKSNGLTLEKKQSNVEQSFLIFKSTIDYQ
jgi:hypothetical protein